MNCLVCRKGIDLETGRLGIEIRNYVIDIFDSEIYICKFCCEKIVLKVIAGEFSFKTLNRILKGEGQ